MKVSATNCDGPAVSEEVASAVKTGNDLTIGINGRYIVDALAGLEEDVTLRNVGGELDPLRIDGVLAGFAEHAVICVAMPMRM